MRAIWSGAVTFGLVNVPVKLYSATESHDVPLHQVHDADGGRIKYERRCSKDGEVVPYEHIARAYDDGTHVVMLTDDDLKKLPAERNREIEVVEFVPSEQVDPIRFEKSYFLEPSDKSAKAYTLLRRTLESTDRTAIVRFALRQRTRLGALRVHGDALVLQALLWDDEVRDASFPSLETDARVTEKELSLAQVVVESLEADFDPTEFVDEYQAELRELIEAKLEQGDAVASQVPEAEGEERGGGEVLDLMEALRRSVAKKRGTGSGAGSDAGSDEKPKASRRTSSSAGSKSAKDSPENTPARRRKSS